MGDVDVVARDSSLDMPDPPEGVVVEAPETSQLSRLRARVEKARSESWMDLEVPRLGGSVICRYKPLSETKRTQIQKYRSKSTDDQSLMYAVDVVAWCNEGVWLDVSIEDVKSGVPPTFPAGFADPNLWVELEVSSATNAVLELFVEEGDIVGTAAKLFEFSGFVSGDLLERTRGNS